MWGAISRIGSTEYELVVALASDTRACGLPSYWISVPAAVVEWTHVSLLCTNFLVHYTDHLRFWNGRFSWQRVCIKFCQKLGKTVMVTFEMLKWAFGESDMGCTQTFEWHSCFKIGWISVDNDECSEWPSSSTMSVFMKTDIIPSIMSAILLG